VILFLVVRNTRLKFLFVRPDWAKLDKKPAYRLQPAE
jgi:hypothetical protein